MADTIDKAKYFGYVERIVSMLKDDKFYNDYKKRVLEGKNNYDTFKKWHKKVLDMTWVKAIEDCIPDLDAIVRNPRKFIAQEEDIVDISLARSISTESVKHLAQHTNMIAQVDKRTGDVTPNKILNISKEESFEIYENRFIYTLLRNLKQFVSQRFEKIKAACAMKDVFQMSVDSDFKVNNKKMSVKLDVMAQMSFEELMDTKNAELSDIERVAKIDRIISDFLSSAFAKQMVSSSPVRPPIQRTNVILKNPNFKKALVLWGFIENYRDEGFKLVDEVESVKVMDDPSINALTDLVTLNSFIFETLALQGKTDDQAEFFDWDQKFDQEQPAVEDVTSEEQTTEEEQKTEEQTEETKTEEPEKTDEQQEEQPPELDVDKEFYPFEIKKLYKRPDDDRVTPEEIRMLNQAIDRVLAAYYEQRTPEQIEAENVQRARRKELERVAEEELEHARILEEKRVRALEEKQRFEALRLEIEEKQKVLDELQKEADRIKAEEVTAAEYAEKKKKQEELDELIRLKAEELVALRKEEEASAVVPDDAEEENLTELPIDEAAEMEAVFNRALGAVQNQFDVDEQIPDIEDYTLLKDDDEPYDPDEEAGDDKYLVARRMISSRFRQNRENNVRESENAHKTLENIYRAFSSMRKNDDVRF